MTTKLTFDELLKAVNDCRAKQEIFRKEIEDKFCKIEATGETLDKQFKILTDRSDAEKHLDHLLNEHRNKNTEHWYYFGKCTPYPKQLQKGCIPREPYTRFNTKEECQSFIDADTK